MALLTGLRVPQPHWRPKGLMLLMMVLIVLSCTSGKASYDRALIRPGAVLDVEQGELADAQRHSLEYLFYRNNPLPKVPSGRELRNLERDLAAAPPVEVEELRRLFGNDLELLAYATRDSDGDGVLDYRISEYRGKFFEGDIDLDGDGVRNVYDIAPYDPKVGGVDTDGDGIPDLIGSFADRDGDGIPDHLDWSPRKPEALATIQSRLFRDFGVILVERSARFTPEMVQAADDALRLVFREPMPTLRTIAIEDQLLISPDLGDNGFMVGQTQTLTIYSKSLEGSPPLVVLGLFIHELDHAWQLAQDFDADDLAVENKRLHFPHGKFTSSLEGYGWAADPKSMGDGYQHVLYWPHFYSTAPRYEYRDSTPAEWAEWFETLEAEQGDAFLRSSAVTSRGLVGTYALTSPWEWHADYLMASVYNRLDRR
ncbi:MAG: thrombospondin type 3 repeat-containing protein, partial [Myxococcales bacterium]|nr:thrombospondin type 3 repeat-containing protein [Myxococcales bacterium]